MADMCSKAYAAAIGMCLLVEVIGFVSSCTQCKDYRLAEFDGKAVTDFHLSTFMNVMMPAFCNRRCSEDNRCKSYRYNPRTRTCSTYGCGYSVLGKTLNPVTDEDGSRLYSFCGKSSFGTKCVTSSNCAFGKSKCEDGVCTCMFGASYDVMSGDCLIRCTAYGKEISTYPASGVDSCNSKILSRPTIQAGAAACAAETDFVCVNAEHDNIYETCNLCDTPALELPVGYLVANDEEKWHLAIRHCAH
ncbi:uncharacterized protein [Haliotis cracherodii]|uniref:uncharacterized protein n=1 Tax=Haliotis cracherodii TaxID=6455 RepID=UPI0039E87EF5